MSRRLVRAILEADPEISEVEVRERHPDIAVAVLRKYLSLERRALGITAWRQVGEDGSITIPIQIPAADYNELHLAAPDRRVSESIARTASESASKLRKERKARDRKSRESRGNN